LKIGQYLARRYGQKFAVYFLGHPVHVYQTFHDILIHSTSTKVINLIGTKNKLEELQQRERERERERET